VTPIRSSAGRLKLGTLLLLILLVGAVYAGFQILPVWLDYYNFKDTMDQRVQMAEIASDADIRNGLLHKAQELGLPITDMDIRIQRTSSEVTLSTEWTVKIALWGFFDWEMAFSPIAVHHIR
jgi:hypothetical protein